MSIHNIASALVSALGAHLWSAPYAQIAPTLEYLPEYEPEQLETLRVSVVPASWFGELASRDSSDEDLRVDVGVQQRVPLVAGAPDSDRMASLTNLCREIARYCLTLDVLAGVAQVSSVTIDPLYSSEHLREDGVFLSVISVTFKEVASL